MKKTILSALCIMAVYMLNIAVGYADTLDRKSLPPNPVDTKGLPFIMYGKICVGPLKFKVVHPSTHYIVIDGGKEIEIPQKGIIPVEVKDTHADHEVRILYEGRDVWKKIFNFNKLNTNWIQLRRSPGYWHFDPIMYDDCGKL